MVGDTRTLYVNAYFEVEMANNAKVNQDLTIEDVDICENRYCSFMPLAISDIEAIGMPIGNFGTRTFITEIMEPDNANVTWRIYYPGGGLRIQTTTTNNLSYLVQDHINSTAMTLNNSGAVIGEIVYSAFGETRATYGTTPTKKLYTSQYEAEAGLYFYNARWFDNEIGRFAQADTIIPDSLDPQSWNRYTYVNNNPINFTDPSGQCIDVQDGLCMRRVLDNSYRVVRGGSVFPNYVEGAIANSILSQDTRYLNIIPNSSSGTIFRSIAAAGSQLGYGNFNTLFDQALDPSIPLVGAGVISGWVLKPGQPGQSYIQGLEGGNPDAHAWSKHGPHISDWELKIDSVQSSTSKTRFIDENEMALAIENALVTNISDITSRANSASRPYKISYNGPDVSYNGFVNENGSVVQKSGLAITRVVIWFDGHGNWGLFTAYPRP